MRFCLCLFQLGQSLENSILKVIQDGNGEEELTVDKKLRTFCWQLLNYHKVFLPKVVVLWHGSPKLEY